MKNIEAKFQAITEYALDAIIMINNKGKVVFWNKAAEKIFGYTKEEILDKNLHQLLTPERYQSAFNEGFNFFKQSGKGNAIGKIIELSAIRKDKTEFPIELSVGAVRINDEWQSVGIIRDITDRKALEHQLIIEKNNLESTVEFKTQELKYSLNLLEKALHHRDKFLSNMSHELRTPLNAIIGFTGLLKNQYYGKLNNTQMEHMELINKSGTHLLDLINDILNISRIDSGQIDLKYKKFSILDLILESFEIIEQQYKTKNISLSYNPKEDLPLINSDFLRCKQILLNFLSNALKFTPSGGEVEVIAENFTSEKIKLSIKDTGIGIDPKFFDNIFLDFYRIDKNSNELNNGIGIGLALNKKTIELLGGDVGVESTLNEGSTFWFTIPVIPETK